jgi:hypothetical protein
VTAVPRDAALRAWDVLRVGAMRTRDGALEVLEGPGLGPAPLWPLTQVHWAAAEVVALGGAADVEAFRPAFRRLRSGDAYAATPGGRRFYDDNAWLGLSSLRLLEVTGDDAHRRRAERAFAFVRHGETRAGGIRWAERSPSRNACSTAPAAWLALERGALPDDVVFAERTMAWLERTLLRPDGLVADRISRGKVVPSVWSYNQGAAIAAWRRLGRSDLAGSTAEAALARFTGDRLWREPPAFAVVLFRVLLERPTRRVVSTLDAYLERLLDEARDPSGWFVAGGVGSYDGRPTIDQAAVVQLFALRALLPRPR